VKRPGRKVDVLPAQRERLADPQTSASKYAEQNTANTCAPSVSST
jgi:hypothetical protein